MAGSSSALAFQPNAAWCDRMLERHLGRIAARFGPDFVPQARQHEGGSSPFRHYGDGAFGCVYAVSKPGLVLKATTDPQEVVFADFLRRSPLDGFVRYVDAVALPEEHDGQTVFLLWREEAFDLGSWPDEPGFAEAAGVLHAYHEASVFPSHARQSDVLATLSLVQAAIESARGRSVDELLAPRAWLSRMKGPAKLASAMAVCLVLATLLEQQTPAKELGRSLVEAFERDWLVVDTMQDNAGFVKRGRKRMLVITDPSRVVCLAKDPPSAAIGAL